MSKKLEGKVAIVIGAAGRDNMGQVIAQRFAREGARVVVAGRSIGELERFAGTIGGAAKACDITRKDEVLALFDFAGNWGGQVDIAVNATGWGLLKGFTDTTEDELDRITELQFKGPFYFFQAAVDTLARGGSIIQISSATATIMLNDHAAYMGTKAGTDHVVRCVAHEYGERGIRANSISPGLTDTPMTAGAKDVPGLFDSFLSGYPLGRIGTKEDIAAAAVFLASDECFMTGQNLQVNGGLTLRRNPTREEIQAAVASAGAGQA
ncbi:SDR family oxidoreductase [Thauera linaloolentis]|uniref:Short-chain dehydrogenase/reductase SDR n=1 Tax=Thauera linaloolentis (strain DSM 12138 / JCM 21573 / CCUG 41526 / CIP 105981 / IAM 15112 / NBRC 102519 / 47Lol) TaxID=1123367 RepID=N6YY18_THAL4|nr:SDR family oxidoreductase [Thauera linaloolentis]ENO87292.1 short-chain dehydrogenase/reductase SDR [Thauera linaloolentis 47Lol = DSM 12138]MCM8566741.1 SDR family oxidoreductase [Thauera linaloolentis]